MDRLKLCADGPSLFAPSAAKALPPTWAPPPPHEDATFLDEVLPCSLSSLATLLFAEKSPYQAAWAAKLRALDTAESPWLLVDKVGHRVAVREVKLRTPAPGAWTSVVGELPIASRRNQTVHTYLDSSELLVEEETHLEIPFGSTFQIEVQYLARALTAKTCRLRVSFRLVFSSMGMMKPLLVRMVRSEHEVVFAMWTPFLRAYLGVAPSPRRVAAAPAGARGSTRRVIPRIGAALFAACGAAALAASLVLLFASCAGWLGLALRLLPLPGRRLALAAEAVDASPFLDAVGRSAALSQTKPLASLVALLILSAGTLLAAGCAAVLCGLPLPRLRRGVPPAKGKERQTRRRL